MFAEFLPFKQTSGGVCLYVKVTPKAAQNRIGKLLPASDNSAIQLKIYVTAAAEDGKANSAVIELLAKQLGIARSLISITSGHIQHSKTCLIRDNSPQVFLALRSMCG